MHICGMRSRREKTGFAYGEPDLSVKDDDRRIEGSRLNATEGHCDANMIRKPRRLESPDLYRRH